MPKNKNLKVVEVVVNDDVNICSHCGAKMRTYWHSLNKQLCMALFALYKIDKPSNIASIGLTHNQICNFQKLKHWGMVDKAESGESGVWEITLKGKSFCRDKKAVPKRVKTFRDQVCDDGHSDDPNDYVYISQVLNKEWKKISDYIYGK